MDALSGTKKT